MDERLRFVAPIEATNHRRRNSSWDWPDFEWEDTRIDVLEALGRGDDAQAARWGALNVRCHPPIFGHI